MRKPTRKEIHNYEHNLAVNGLFRDVDQTLAAKFTPDERVVVMVSIWPAVTKLAETVIRRTVFDLTGGRR